jgi:glycosyltransferase involved in cell wall biosynthesis
VCTLHNYRLLCANGTLERDGKPCDACIGGSGVAAIRYGCYRSSRLQSAVWAAGRAQAAMRGTWSSAVDRFIAPSTAVRDEYVLAGFEPARIDVRAHFTDDPGECPGERSGVLYVGRLSRHKGIVDLIRKWPSDEPTLTVIGTGPEESEVVAAAGPNVILLGERTPEQVSREMSKAAVVVLPSRVRESFGLTLIEAAAHGCAAVAYDRGGPRDIIVPDCTGSLVPFDRPEQFLPQVLSLARCAEVSRRRGERARQWYLGRFTPERGLRSLLDVYERALTPRADVA